MQTAGRLATGSRGPGRRETREFYRPRPTDAGQRGPLSRWGGASPVPLRLPVPGKLKNFTQAVRQAPPL
jgi:hypothetical protein